MASGTITFDASLTAESGSYIIGKVTWSSSADKAANNSDVTAKLYVRKLHTDMILTEPTSGTWSYRLEVNGSAASGSVSLSVLDDWVLVATKTVNNIAHGSNGAKSITIEGWVTAPSGTSLAGHRTEGSKSVALDTIARAATVDALTCSTSYLDGTLTAKYTPRSASHYIRRIVSLSYGGVSTKIRTTDLGQKSASQQTSTINFSAAELSAIYAKVTDTTSAKLVVKFETYSDSGYLSRIGSAEKSITLTIPTAIKPTASLSVSAVNTNTWIKGLGVYVEGYSKVKLSLTASPGEGASLSSTTISGEDFSHAGTSITAAIASAGSYTFTGKAVDTRGRSASNSKSITVLPYSHPAVTSLKFERGEYTSQWEPGENGPDVRITFKTTLGLVDQGNTYNAAFTLDGSSKAPNGGVTTEIASGVTRAVYFLDLDSEVSHALTLTVTDKVGAAANAAVTIPSKNVTIDFNKSGKGIAFGKTSEDNVFACAWPAHFDGFIYTDGLRVPLVQWGTASITPSAANTPTSKVVTFPTAFPGNPAVILTPQTSVPGTTVLGAGTSDRSASGVTVWATRTNTTATVVHWVAIY